MRVLYKAIGVPWTLRRGFSISFTRQGFFLGGGTTECQTLEKPRRRGEEEKEFGFKRFLQVKRCSLEVFVICETDSNSCTRQACCKPLSFFFINLVYLFGIRYDRIQYIVFLLYQFFSNISMAILSDSQYQVGVSFLEALLARVSVHHLSI